MGWKISQTAEEFEEDGAVVGPAVVAVAVVAVSTILGRIDRTMIVLPAGVIPGMAVVAGTVMMGLVLAAAVFEFVFGIHWQGEKEHRAAKQQSDPPHEAAG
jgi:hypothetical protein